MHSTGKLIKIILLMQYFNTSGTIFAFDYVIKQMFIREKITLVACKKKMVPMSFGKKSDSN